MSKGKGIALTAARVVLTLALYLVAAFVLGLALVPAVLLVRAAWSAGILWACWAAGAGYFLFGFSLMSLATLGRFLFRLDLKEGTYPLGSPGMLKLSA